MSFAFILNIEEVTHHFNTYVTKYRAKEADNVSRVDYEKLRTPSLLSSRLYIIISSDFLEYCAYCKQVETHLMYSLLNQQMLLRVKDMRKQTLTHLLPDNRRFKQLTHALVLLTSNVSHALYVIHKFIYSFFAPLVHKQFLK